MFRIGSLKLSYTRTCPVKSKRSPVFRANTWFATSAQLVSNAANIAQKKYMGTLCQICGIFSSGKGRAYTHPFGCVLYKEGLYIFYSSYKCWNNLKVVFSNYSNIKVEEEYSPVSGGVYCRIDAVALFPDGTGVGELTFLVSSRGNVFFSICW